MTTVEPVQRAYMRHPANMPIEIRCETPSEVPKRRLKDVSLGGLSCSSTWPLLVDTIVNISIPVTQPPFELRGRVVWCVRHGQRFDLGIAFMDTDDAFAARMIEQICHIENYRSEVLRQEGRVLDSETAAKEWIEKFAPNFGNPYQVH
ncbi:MAG TPA: PilZ domain-containing protein [Rhodocyclaceae bacterium]|nr:PilZ domain-containing protein [Rhodocyclaceae bacterium]